MLPPRRSRTSTLNGKPLPVSESIKSSGLTPNSISSSRLAFGDSTGNNCLPITGSSTVNPNESVERHVVEIKFIFG